MKLINLFLLSQVVPVALGQTGQGGGGDPCPPVPGTCDADDPIMYDCRGCFYIGCVGEGLDIESCVVVPSDATRCNREGNLRGIGCRQTATPSATPSVAPSESPTATPSTAPSATPSAIPSAAPSPSPSAVPSVAPSATPSISPSAVPSVVPSANPSPAPSTVPSASPSEKPTKQPTPAPVIMPTNGPVCDACCENPCPEGQECRLTRRKLDETLITIGTNDGGGDGAEQLPDRICVEPFDISALNQPTPDPDTIVPIFLEADP